MVTREQMIAILSFVGATAVAISATLALYWQVVEIQRLKAELKAK